MKIFKRVIDFSINRPKVIMGFTFLLVLLALIQFPKIKIDTDPENMLSEKEFVRIFHDKTKKEFALYDFIILGVVNEEDDNGVFNPETLKKVYGITEEIKRIDGVITREIIAPSTKDNIRQAGLGSVSFEWLMPEPPYTDEQALYIKREAKDNPLFDGTIVSEDGKALCVYVPIKEKSQSYRISQDIFGIIDRFDGIEKYHITGLPVAEDTFGVQMFKQMALSAPLAGLIIFILMWLFFRNVKLIISPMLVAMSTVIGTMGALIGNGFTVHIMSSMIPIFLMPIAVVDSVHILSEFFEKYPIKKNKRETIEDVMSSLFMPMLYTSLTTSVGFASLAFTPIPPVRIFGIYVALGVMFAWVLTMTFIPAFIMLISDRSFEGYGAKNHDEGKGRFSVILGKIGAFSVGRWKPVVIVALGITALSLYGITKININDNPVNWFSENHRIRVADRVLNAHFGGTYTAYLVLDSGALDSFKSPRLLRYIEGLQDHLVSSGKVGKTTALTDVVKKVYYELMDGNKAYNRIPDSAAAVAQCLISYQNSHKPDDLWHFADPDYTKINMWLQLKSGDNRDTEEVTRIVEDYLDKNPPPIKLKHNWAGLTYINVVWQDKMVSGMLKSLMGSFIIVFFMMVFLFRSPILGFFAMLPLSITILFIYGLIGIIGKDYDMPVAVLSSLTLGLSVDFAIHFLERSREIYRKIGNWQGAIREIFQEPARAITKNAIIISVGFTPLLAAPLVPYQTVGLFFMLIMAASGITTLILLPAAITPIAGLTFKRGEKKRDNGGRQ
ncbi:MAG: MMPL family transporter [Candidatus Omnitrophota bacterium]